MWSMDLVEESGTKCLKIHFCCPVLSSFSPRDWEQICSCFRSKMAWCCPTPAPNNGFFFPKRAVFIYAWLCWCASSCAGFLSRRASRLLPGCSVRAPRCRGFSVVEHGLRRWASVLVVRGSVVVVRVSRHCRLVTLVWAYLCSMWIFPDRVGTYVFCISKQSSQHWATRKPQ